MSTIDVADILKSSSAQPPEKRSRFDADGSSNGNGQIKVDEEDDTTTTIFDENAVKRLILQLDKRMLKNREMRIKHADEPQKFMDSELELNVAVQEMHAIATQPDLYEVLVENNVISSLLQLLSHENTDIVAAVIGLLQELTDVETLNESDEGASALVDALVDAQLIATLTQSIDRMNETLNDEIDAVHNALAIVENVLDFRPAVADTCVEQGLFHWLLKRVGQKGPFDGNKMYSSELLALLLQCSEEARKALTDKVDGIDILLRALAVYKRHDPASHDEREHMENLFNSLCAALMFTPNRQKFLDGEGLQLMNLMLRERKQSRESAMKVLSHATNGPEGKGNCDKFVEILGLRTLFPLFMRTPSKSKRKDTSADEHEEHACSVIASLLKSCSDINRGRLLTKFVEQDYAKMDRLVELYFKYSDRVKSFDAKQHSSNGGTLKDVDDEQIYLDKLDAGLFTLQLVSLIIVDVSANSPSCHERAAKLLNMKGSNFKSVVSVLDQYCNNLGVDADVERERVKHLIEAINCC